MLNGDLSKWEKVAVIIIWSFIGLIFLIGIGGGWAYLLSLCRGG